MPPYEMFTKGRFHIIDSNSVLDFAKEIFEGSKKLLKLGEVKFITVIKYDELSVKRLYSKFL